VTGAGFALLVAIFYVVVAVMIACEMRAADPVDQLTEEQLDHDVLMCQFEEITEGLDR